MSADGEGGGSLEGKVPDYEKNEFRAACCPDSPCDSIFQTDSGSDSVRIVDRDRVSLSPKLKDLHIDNASDKVNVNSKESEKMKNVEKCDNRHRHRNHLADSSETIEGDYSGRVSGFDILAPASAMADVAAVKAANIGMALHGTIVLSLITKEPPGVLIVADRRDLLREPFKIVFDDSIKISTIGPFAIGMAGAAWFCEQMLKELDEEMRKDHVSKMELADAGKHVYDFLCSRAKAKGKDKKFVTALYGGVDGSGKTALFVVEDGKFRVLHDDLYYAVGSGSTSAHAYLGEIINGNRLGVGKKTALCLAIDTLMEAALDSVLVGGGFCSIFLGAGDIKEMHQSLLIPFANLFGYNVSGDSYFQPIQTENDVRPRVADYEQFLQDSKGGGRLDLVIDIGAHADLSEAIEVLGSVLDAEVNRRVGAAKMRSMLQIRNSRIVCLPQVVTVFDIKDDDRYNRIMDVMRKEGSRFGKLLNVFIPRPQRDRNLAPGVGNVFLEYADTDASTKARAGLNGWVYGKYVVEAVFYPENKYYRGEAQQQILIQRMLLQTAISKVVCLTKVVTVDELNDDEEYECLIECMRTEGCIYGEVVNVVVPRRQLDGSLAPGVGNVFLEYANTDDSSKAQAGMNGRKFDENEVVAVFYPENNYYGGSLDGEFEEPEKEVGAGVEVGSLSSGAAEIGGKIVGSGDALVNINENCTKKLVSLEKIILATPATKVVCLPQCVTLDELKDDDKYKRKLEDVRTEGAEYGTLVNVFIPPPPLDGNLTPGVGNVFLEYADTDFSTNAVLVMTRIKGKKAVFYPENKYYGGQYDCE